MTTSEGRMRMLYGMMLALGLALAPAPALATNHEPGAAAVDGEVRKVDRDAMKITIRHGPIVSLDMPAMTMVFQVKDPALLDHVQPGDKVRFVADKIGGQFWVMRLETLK